MHYAGMQYPHIHIILFIGSHLIAQCKCTPRRAKVLSPLSIPPQTIHLTLICVNEDHFHDFISLIPRSVTHLTFQHYNGPVTDIPASFTKIITDDTFDQPLDVVDLPPALTHLVVGDSFSHQLDNLPHSLRHLTLGRCPHLCVDKLPPKLTHLSFGSNFLSSINKLPSTLTHLTTGEDFNHRLDQLHPSLPWRILQSAGG